MTFDCQDLDRALASDEGERLELAHAHARTCARCRSEIALDAEIAAAAGSMRKQWETPALWPSTLAAMRASSAPRTGVRSLPPALAIAAALVLSVSGLSWVVWQAMVVPPQTPAAAGSPGSPGPERPLLDERTLAEVERAEAQYVNAIEALAQTARARATASDSPLLLTLRERLLAIDAAIADCRAEIERNRFNTHMRRQLLSMYQEKRRTLEQILESNPNAL